MKLKPALFLIHRWLGIGMCLLFALWFASGIVMMYVEYPELTEEERLANLQSIELSAVQIDPSTAIGSIQKNAIVSSLSLANVMGRPAYQFTLDENDVGVVFADNGEILNSLSESRALEAVRKSGFYFGSDSLQYDGIRDYDQWTLSSGLNDSRPLHRVKLSDVAGTVVYVSDRTGRIVRDTNRREMLWNWIGSTIHWIYPKQLRSDVNLWIQVVVYLSLAGIVSVVTGAIIGFMRVRILDPYRGKDYSPYSGMMKWHHLLGLLSLVFVATFIFSGLMSMGPWGVFESSTPQSEQIARYTEMESIPIDRLPDPRDLSWSDEIKEIRWQSIAGEPYLVALRSPSHRWVQFDSNKKEDQSMVLLAKLTSAIPSLLPDSKLTNLDLLHSHDDYYYTRHNRYRPLPVFRAMFDDKESTWFHIDLNTGAVVNRVTYANRVERWIYNGLHSLDFQFLLSRRPLWDVLMIVLSIIGLTFSATSVVIGWRRLRNS